MRRNEATNTRIDFYKVKVFYPNTLPKYYDGIEEWINDAFDWMSEKYGDFFYNHRCDVWLGRGRKGCFYPNDYAGSEFTHPTIKIGLKNTLIFYKKKTAELTTPKGGLRVGFRTYLTSVLIHELTHFVQYLEERPYSEVETTRNQIEHLKQVDEFWFGKLVSC